MSCLFRPLHCTDEETEVFLQQGWERLELGSQRVRAHEDEGLKTSFLTSLVSWGSLSVDKGERGHLGWGWILMVSWLSTLYLALKLDCFGATGKIFCLCWTCSLSNVECVLKCILLLDMVPVQTFLTVWGKCRRRQTCVPSRLGTMLIKLFELPLLETSNIFTNLDVPS